MCYIWSFCSVVSIENVLSSPFSIQVVNPILRIVILRQPSGSAEVAETLPVQPILLIQSRSDCPSIVGQLVQAIADPSCYASASTLSGFCTVMDDNKCTFQKLAVVGITAEVATFVTLDVKNICNLNLFPKGSSKNLLSFLYFRKNVWGVTSSLCERGWCSNFHSYLMCTTQVTDTSIPKVSALNNWQELLWSVFFIIAPISALNNADSGAFIWIVGLTTFTYFCAKYM